MDEIATLPLVARNDKKSLTPTLVLPHQGGGNH
jgi:hypothetical protein